MRFVRACFHSFPQEILVLDLGAHIWFIKVQIGGRLRVLRPIGYSFWWSLQCKCVSLKLTRIQALENSPHFFLLDYSIRGPPPILYHLSFMVGLTEEVSSSMVSKSRSWVQFPLTTHFLPPRIIILTYLVVRWVHTWPERVATTHT
jgi:hypothetical protein